jgi:hypothetical protein
MAREAIELVLEGRRERGEPRWERANGESILTVSYAAR